jgi:hypothetical protein
MPANTTASTSPSASSKESGTGPDPQPDHAQRTPSTRGGANRVRPLGRRSHHRQPLDSVGDARRVSRYTILVPLPGARTMDALNLAVTAAMLAVRDALKRSLGWDQGKEIHGHEALAVSADLTVYVCNPHSPWQRGSVAATRTPTESFASGFRDRPTSICSTARSSPTFSRRCTTDLYRLSGFERQRTCSQRPVDMGGHRRSGGSTHPDRRCRSRTACAPRRCGVMGRLRIDGRVVWRDGRGQRITRTI